MSISLSLTHICTTQNICLATLITASKCAQTSNRTVHSKRQTDRWMTAQRKKTCHTKSALHTPHTPDIVHCTTKWKFSSSHQVSVSACVFVGGRCVTCTGVIVDRCPLKLLCRTDSCLVCTPVAGGATVCVQPNLPLSISLSLATSIFPAIHFIHPPTPFIPHLSLRLAYINLPFSEQTLILYLSNTGNNDDALQTTQNWYILCFTL